MRFQINLLNINHMHFTSSDSFTVSNHHVGAYVRNVGPSIHPGRIGLNKAKAKVVLSVHR